MSDKNKQNILDIIDSINKIISYTSRIDNADHLFREELIFDAVMMNFIIIGESVSRLSDDFIQKHTDIDWPKIKGLRNIIAHDYFGIDAEEIWQVIITDISALKANLNRIL